MKIDWRKIKEVLTWKNVKRAVFNFLEKRSAWFLYLVIFVLFAYGTYLWYGSVYNPRWSEDRAKQYIDEGTKGVVFNQGKFKEVLDYYNIRDQAYNSSPADLADIFRLKNN